MICTKEYTIVQNVWAAYWAFDEASSPWYDSVLGLDLQQFGAISIDTGILGNSIKFHDNVDGFGSLARYVDTAFVLQPLDGFSVVCWVYADAYPRNAYVMPFRLYLTDTAGYAFDFSLIIRANGGINVAGLTESKSGSSGSITFAAPPVGVWTFYHVYYNNISHKFGLQINDGVPTEVDLTLEIADYANPNTSTLWVSSVSASSAPQFGRVDELGFRTEQFLTKTQADWLYNSGAGRTWPEVDSVLLH